MKLGVTVKRGYTAAGGSQVRQHPHRAPADAALAGRRPAAVRRDERRPRGDALPAGSARPRGQRRLPRPDRGPVPAPGVRALGPGGDGDRAVHRVHRPEPDAAGRARRGRHGGGLAAGQSRLASGVRHRGRHRRGRRGLQRGRPDRDLVHDGGAQRGVRGGNAPPRHDAARALRPPEDRAWQSTAPARGLPARPAPGPIPRRRIRVPRRRIAESASPAAEAAEE